MARAWRRRTRWSPSRATRPASSAGGSVGTRCGLEGVGRGGHATAGGGGGGPQLVPGVGGGRAEGLGADEGGGGGCALTGFLAPPRETLATARLVWTCVAVGGAGS